MLSDKEKLLKKLMAQKGLGKPVETSRPKGSKRSAQLDKFLGIIGHNARAIDYKLTDNYAASTVERTLANAGGFQDAYQEDSRVMYVGNAICSEIVYAMDFVPFNGQVLSYFLAAAGASGAFLDMAEKKHLSRDICPVVRCTLGAAMEDCLPTPDYMTFGYFPCDSGARMFYALGDIYDCPYFLLDVPERKNHQAAVYLAGRLKEMVAHMERSLGITADPDRIARVVEESKATLRYYEKLITFSLRHQICPSVHKFTTDMTSHLTKLGAPQSTEGVRLCHEELRNAVETAGGTRKKDRPRVIWDGQMPFYSNEIIRHLEENLGLEVMSNMIPALARDLDDMMAETDPYLYMAKRMMHYSKIDSTKFDLLDTYEIDGVIRFNQWGCRRHLSVNQIARDGLSKSGIAMLDIDGDFIDSRGYSFSQVKIRLDAFAEMLNNRSEI
ncbi:MAG: 2-hydroxyacyl-CoA dehydratase family protein [Desulfobacterales bacterium]|nr:2-hydroxyacyl-CoA dehydratase family protein [Desulfobacterales bacterium]